MIWLWQQNALHKGNELNFREINWKRTFYPFGLDGSLESEAESWKLLKVYDTSYVLQLREVQWMQMMLGRIASKQFIESYIRERLLSIILIFFKQFLWLLLKNYENLSL